MRPCQNNRAFTLIELLVVIAIIGTLAAVGLPALRGFNKSNSMAAATRQLLDDVALARQRAIAGRTTVYMVFLGDNYWGPLTVNEQVNSERLLDKRYTGYFLASLGSVGDQPGRHRPRFLTPWRSLPEGVIIPREKFNTSWNLGNGVQITNASGELLTIKPFSYTNVIPFPAETSRVSTLNLPFIAFDSSGRLTSDKDEFIPLAQGSIFYPRDASDPTKYTRSIIPVGDVVETPPGNFTNTFNVIHIDALTGRARLQRQELK